MNIKICNPKEDRYGNIKENIFLAFNDEGNYIGCSWVYSGIRYHEIHETPYTIFIEIDMEDELEEGLEAEAKQRLFDKVFYRAKEIRMERPDLKARIYAAFFEDKELMNFYINNGFDEDYSILMEADIPKNFTYELPEDIEVIEVKIDSEEELMEYKVNRDEMFITPVNEEEFTEYRNQRYFKVLKFLRDGKLQGGCTIFERDGYAVIDTLYVDLESRGQGVGKILVNYIFNYFASKGIYKTQLQVWELNKRAVNLYKSFGYKEVRKTIMSPGITL